MTRTSRANPTDMQEERNLPPSVARRHSPRNEAEGEYSTESEDEDEESRLSSSSLSGEGNVVYPLYLFLSNYFSGCRLQTIILKTYYINQQRIVRVQVPIEKGK